MLRFVAPRRSVAFPELQICASLPRVLIQKCRLPGSIPSFPAVLGSSAWSSDGERWYDSCHLNCAGSMTRTTPRFFRRELCELGTNQGSNICFATYGKRKSNELGKCLALPRDGETEWFRYPSGGAFLCSPHSSILPSSRTPECATMPLYINPMIIENMTRT